MPDAFPNDLLGPVEWFFFGYYVVLQTIYFVLAALAFVFARRRRADALSLTGTPPPVSLLIPMYNEGAGGVRSVRSALAQTYPDFEIILVNDGSTDDTLEQLREVFGFEPASPVPLVDLPHAPLRGRFRSATYPHLVLLDKENGGKSDSLNAALCHARYPIICNIDGDSVLVPDALRRGVRPFVEHPDTVGVGATLGILNGCDVDEAGRIGRVGISSNFWVIVQVLEYLRAFLIFRLGWTAVRAVPLISGAFGLYARDWLVGAGGYRHDTRGEDLEVTLRLHRYGRREKRPYRLGFVPEVLCWTDVPDGYRSLRRQRATWHRSLVECLSMNRGLLREGGVVGLLLFPFYVVFEALAPVVELAGYLFVVVAFVLGVLSFEALFSLLVLVLGVGMLLGAVALLLDVVTSGRFDGAGALLKLFAVALLENLGYRQLHAVWRCTGLVEWMLHPGTTLRTDLARTRMLERTD